MAGLFGSTLGGGLATVVTIVSTLGSLGGAGCRVARFNTCAIWMYALVVADPYCSESMLF